MSLHIGAWEVSPSKAADNILEAINLFNESAGTKHLKHVRIVIYDQATMESFGGCFLERAATHANTPSHVSDETARHDLG